MSSRGGKKQKSTPTKRISKSKRAGIAFPVGRVFRAMKKAQTRKQRIAVGAPIYVAAVMEYLSAEVIELAGNAARDTKRKRIIPRHIMLAVRHDQELSQLCKEVTFPMSGVTPSLHSALLPRKSKARAASRFKVKTSAVSFAIGAKKASASTAMKVQTPQKTSGKAAAGKKGQKGGKKRKAGGITILGEKRLFLGQKLTIVSGDIVDINADAIIHPTNGSLSLAGEVGSQLAKVGGQAFRQKVVDVQHSIGGLGTMEAAICDGVGFAAPYVIHCHGPSWSGPESCIELDTAVKNCLELAEKENLTSICFPSIGSGRAGFPKQAAAQTILRSISQYFKGVMASSIKQVYFDLYDQESVNVYTTELAKLEK